MTRTCHDCATPLSRQNVVGRCRPCAARVNGKSPTRAAALSRTRASMPNISAIMRSISLRKIAWCPLEYRDDYRKIARIMPAAEARAHVEHLIAVDAARYARTGKLQRTAGECAHR